jgi:hypothetical protein
MRATHRERYGLDSYSTPQRGPRVEVDVLAGVAPRVDTVCKVSGFVLEFLVCGKLRRERSSPVVLKFSHFH